MNIWFQLYETLALEEHKLNLYGGYELAKTELQHTNLGYVEDETEESLPPPSLLTPRIKSK